VSCRIFNAWLAGAHCQGRQEEQSNEGEAWHHDIAFPKPPPAHARQN
jgi:hypothetical protein